MYAEEDDAEEFNSADLIDSANATLTLNGWTAIDRARGKVT